MGVKNGNEIPDYDAPVIDEALLDTLNGWIDVRSPGEFALGSLPGTTNRPILNDEERHQVGRCYKLHGQPAAIELGYQLIEPVRFERLAHWIELARQAPPGHAHVMCWRGGLRSRIAADWLRDAGIDCPAVPGGYKAVRQRILQEVARPVDWTVVGGYTGCGKTQLLRQVRQPILDLEKLADHRGSSFGAPLAGEQISQATFENRLGLAMRRLSRGLVEDESRSIGRNVLPDPVWRAMATAKVIWMEATLWQRTQRIFAEYVREPLLRGWAPGELVARLGASVMAISRRLGGLLTAQVVADLARAFEAAQPLDCEAHRPWIEPLLVHYYDKLYESSWQRSSRPIVFRGTYEECEQWIQTSY